MKDLTIEEKAKAYDNLIERLKDFQFEYRFSAFSDTIERYFPEIKEPEDEKIRKDLISFLDDIWHLGKNANFDKWDKSDCSNWIAWLEKQGETVEINPTEFDTRLQGTCQPPDEIIEESHQDNADHIIDIVTEQEKPSEWSEEDERIRRVIRGWIYTRPASFFDGISKEKMLAWIEKQDGKINPYSGTSFKYNNHTWGMCARDNGVEILIDDEIKAFISLEKSFIYPTPLQSNDTSKVGIALEAIKEENVDNANKVEPKFKDGDWIVYKDAVWKVCNIGLQNYYELLKTNNEVGIRLIKDVDENAHLWTIDDAKNGDVLYHKSKSGIEYIVMNKGLNEHGNVNSYFRYNSLDGFGVDIPAVLSTRLNGITPATKEQRDILFKKMKEKGYEWDSEKKEIIKINLN